MEYFDYDNWGAALKGMSRGFDVDALLEQSQENERQRLEDELARIEQQLERRETIHDETVEELESKLDWYLGRLESLYKQEQGTDGRRDELKERIREFYRELREEKQSLWRDCQGLERERREVLRELESIERDKLAEFL